MENEEIGIMDAFSDSSNESDEEPGLMDLF